MIGEQGQLWSRVLEIFEAPGDLQLTDQATIHSPVLPRDEDDTGTCLVGLL